MNGRQRKQADAVRQLEALNLGRGQDVIKRRAIELLRDGKAHDAMDAWVKAQREAS